MNAKFYAEHKAARSLNQGPCGCCNLAGCHPKTRKVEVRRIVRRANKVSLKEKCR